MPDRTQSPEWQRPVTEAPAAPEQPARFEPRGNWIDPVASIVRPRFRA